jgi:hypothetical protein
VAGHSGVRGFLGFRTSVVILRQDLREQLTHSLRALPSLCVCPRCDVSRTAETCYSFGYILAAVAFLLATNIYSSQRNEIVSALPPTSSK